MNQNFSENFELDWKTFYLTNTGEFRKFLIDNNVTATIVSYTVATYLNELIKSFFDDFIFCSLDSDCNEEDLPLFFKILRFKIQIYGMHIKLGKLFVALLKFIISTILVFYISRLIKDIIN